MESNWIGTYLTFWLAAIVLSTTISSSLPLSQPTGQPTSAPSVSPTVTYYPTVFTEYPSTSARNQYDPTAAPVSSASP
ncbi:hypothetical protein EON65_19235, partial [archaeon]